MKIRTGEKASRCVVCGEVLLLKVVQLLTCGFTMTKCRNVCSNVGTWKSMAYAALVFSRRAGATFRKPQKPLFENWRFHWSRGGVSRLF